MKLHQRLFKLSGIMLFVAAFGYAGLFAAPQDARANSAAMAQSELPARADAAKREDGTKAPENGTESIQPLDLNQATAEQFEMLPGLGPKKAQALVEFRTKSGGFKNVQQIVRVKGIGPKMFKRLQPYLFVGALSSRTSARPAQADSKH